MARNPWRTGDQEPETQQTLRFVRFDSAAALRYQWLDGPNLVEQCNVWQNLPVNRRHFHADNRGTDGSAARESKLGTPDLVSRTVHEDRAFDIRRDQKGIREKIDPVGSNPVLIDDARVFEAVVSEKISIGKVGESRKPHEPYIPEQFAPIVAHDLAASVAPAVIASENHCVVLKPVPLSIDIVGVMRLRDLVLERIPVPQKLLSFRGLPRFSENDGKLRIRNRTEVIRNKAQTRRRDDPYFIESGRDSRHGYRKRDGNIRLYFYRCIMRDITHLSDAQIVLSGSNCEVRECARLIGELLPAELNKSDSAVGKRSSGSFRNDSPAHRD